MKLLFRAAPLLAMIVPVSAEAQSEGFELRAFHPSVSQRGGGLIVDDARIGCAE